MVFENCSKSGKLKSRASTRIPPCDWRLLRAHGKALLLPGFAEAVSVKPGNEALWYVLAPACSILTSHLRTTCGG